MEIPFRQSVIDLLISKYDVPMEIATDVKYCTYQLNRKKFIEDDPNQLKDFETNINNYFLDPEVLSDDDLAQVFLFNYKIINFDELLVLNKKNKVSDETKTSILAKPCSELEELYPDDFITEDDAIDFFVYLTTKMYPHHTRINDYSYINLTSDGEPLRLSTLPSEELLESDTVSEEPTVVEETQPKRRGRRKSVEVTKNENNRAITNEENRLILIASDITKSIYPLVSNFVKYTKRNSNRIFSAIVSSILDNRAGCKEKIFMFIDNRVSRTAYSDRVLWNFLVLEGTTIPLFSCKQFRNILSIFPKILIPEKATHDKSQTYAFSAISFIHVIIEKQLIFQFLKKFSVSYRPTDTTSSSLSVFDKENAKHAKDESRIMTKKLLVEFDTKKLLKEVKTDPKKLSQFATFLDKKIDVKANVIGSIFSENFMGSVNDIDYKTHVTYIFTLAVKLYKDNYKETSKLLMSKHVPNPTNVVKELKKVMLPSSYSAEYDDAEIQNIFSKTVVPNLEKIFLDLKDLYMLDFETGGLVKVTINKQLLMLEILSLMKTYLR